MTSRVPDARRVAADYRAADGSARRRMAVASLVALAVFVAVTVAMLWPTDPSIGAPPHFDKVVHVGAWLVLAVVFWHPASYVLETRTRWRSVRARTWALIAALTTWGVAIEMLQGLVPNRSSDVLDALADATGAIIGCTLMAWWESARDAARDATKASAREGTR